jgi:hypothetical protein
MADRINPPVSEEVVPVDTEVDVPVVGRKKPHRDPHALLTGRPPIQEYLAIAQQAAEGSPSDIGALMDQWRAASDQIATLTTTEANAADGADLTPLPADLQELRADYLADPMIMRSFAFLPTDIWMVDLDKVIVFQKTVNLRYARQIGTGLRKHMSASDLMRFCLGIDQQRPPVRFAQAAQNAFSFVSESTDLRCLDVTVLDPNQVSGYTPQGHAARIIGIVVGFSSNALNLVRVNGRLILNNGSHRAYALRDAGQTRVPAVVQEVTRREELTLFPLVSEHTDVYLDAPRPPMLKDYFDPALHTVIELPRRLRQVRVGYGVEVSDAPAMESY